MYNNYDDDDVDCDDDDDKYIKLSLPNTMTIIHGQCNIFFKYCL